MTDQVKPLATTVRTQETDFAGDETAGTADLAERLEVLLTADNVETAWDIAVAAFRDLGFADVLYSYSPDARGPFLGAAEDALILSTKPHAVTREFVIQGYFRNSITFTRALYERGVFSWSSPRTTLPPGHGFVDSEAALRFFARTGMNAGCTVGFVGARNRGAAVMALICPLSEGQEAFDARLPAIRHAVFVLASVTHTVLTALPWLPLSGGLSPRQREVLEWVAEGKTTADIARILGVTPATVDKHLRLARERLGAETTAQALMKASFLNQIFLRRPLPRHAAATEHAY